MNQALRALSGETFAKVMEKQAFMFAEMPKGGADPEGDWRAAAISFKGPFSGTVSLLAPLDMVLELAANFLGQDASEPEVVSGADDSFKELLNVLCGHLLTGMAGEDPIFDLSMPKVAAIPAGEARAFSRSPESLVFAVDGHPVFLQVKVEGDWNPAAPGAKGGD
jgi:chemotaxis protein CheY-P-specific phosphatase CheC